jgi:hypothetical protein
MSTKVYDADQISIVFGTHLIQGYADGEFVSIERDTDAFGDVVGTDGKDVTRFKNKDKRATITVKLMHTSDSNDILSAVAIADEDAPNGAGIAQVMVRDRATGRAKYSGAEAWIVKQPDATYDRSPTPREWKIRVAKIAAFTGGN